MPPSWRCKGLGPTCCHPRAPGEGRKLRCTPLGSRSSRRVAREGSGPEGNTRRSGVWETQPLTQQQQLELAARVLLVPAKLPLDLGADALRLLLLRGQAAAASHGARSPRRATPFPGPGRSAGRSPSRSATAPEVGGKRLGGRLEFRSIRPGPLRLNPSSKGRLRGGSEFGALGKLKCTAALGSPSPKLAQGRRRASRGRQCCRPPEDQRGPWHRSVTGSADRS